MEKKYKRVEKFMFEVNSNEELGYYNNGNRQAYTEKV